MFAGGVEHDGRITLAGELQVDPVRRQVGEAAGRVDGVFVDSVVGETDFLKRPQAKNFAFVGPSFTDPAYFGEGAGIAVRKGDKALLDKLNAAILALRANGEYQKIQSKYFSFDIYGE